MNRDELLSPLNVASRTGLRIPDLAKLSRTYPQVRNLPLALKILLLNLLVRLDGRIVTWDHVLSVINWKPKESDRPEVPFTPSRVVVQDFTGVPAVVDLAAMRTRLKALGKPAGLINPAVQVDVVIDHSVQVDFAGTVDAAACNRALEFSRNGERYALLKWAAQAFPTLRVVRPGFGIVHQVNLERLAPGVHVQPDGVLDLDTVTGTDSHTPHINGAGVLGWGVGGIEAEAAMLGQPTPLVLPDVVALELTGVLPVGTTPTDLVLRVTELLRQHKVVDKFVELCGPGVGNLSVPDRAMLGNMSPEMGCTVVLAPTDEATIEFFRRTNRADEAELLAAYMRAQELFGLRESINPAHYSAVVHLDLSTVTPSVAGPCEPQQRVGLSEVPGAFTSAYGSSDPTRGFSRNAESFGKTTVPVSTAKGASTLQDGAIVIAAITSCTNTSNPSVMLAAGLLARNAVRRGLKVPAHVKTSLAPGSLAVTEMLKRADLLGPLEQLGFNVVGYGCTTCIGNSGPLDPQIEEAITENGLSSSAVLSGNRNFRGRVHMLVDGAFLMSPPLVVAYALAGTVLKDLNTVPIGEGTAGPVFLRDIWPDAAELQRLVADCFSSEVFSQSYADVFGTDPEWDNVPAPTGDVFAWELDSTYVKYPPFFDSTPSTGPITGARVLGMFKDGITTDHISPAGAIAKDSPAGRNLQSLGVAPVDFNQYGARRGNFEVMARGTFANGKLRNLLVTQTGNATRHHPTGEIVSFYEAAVRYRQSGTPVVILAGERYGSGSSRDWAAKGPALLGVRAVIAQSYERIHRSNLVGCGIVPLEFIDGQSAQSLGLTGAEEISIDLSQMTPRGLVQVHAGGIVFNARVRIDNAVELEYWRAGGVLQYVLARLAA